VDVLRVTVPENRPRSILTVMVQRDGDAAFAGGLPVEAIATTSPSVTATQRKLALPRTPFLPCTER
jgi:hypothetical protein